MKTRKEAHDFLFKYVTNEYQRHHAEMVATAMEKVAHFVGIEDKDTFYVCGLIHDWDYDRWPTEHPGRYDVLQRELEVSDDIVMAIKGHTGVSAERLTVLAKTLFACDELSGLLYAYMKMVGNYGRMKAKSIAKKVHKDRNFAAKIDRTHVITGIDELCEATPLDETTFYFLLRDSFAEKYD